MRDADVAEIIAVLWFILAAQADHWLVCGVLAAPGLIALLRSGQLSGLPLKSGPKE